MSCRRAYTDTKRKAGNDRRASQSTITASLCVVLESLQGKEGT